MTRFGSFPAAIVIAVVASACATTSATTDAPSTGGIKLAPKPLTFGLTRPVGAEAASFSATQLSIYFTQSIGPGSTARVFDDAAQLADALVSGQIDAAWLTPGAYVRASSKAGIKPLLKLSRGGFASYKSVFFAKADSGFTNIASVKGKTLALVGPGSVSGRLYPLAYLKKQGIDAEKYFGKIVSGWDHKEVCMIVSQHRADIGATLSDDRGSAQAVVDGCREAGFNPSEFKIIEGTGSIPNDVIAIRADLPQGTIDRVSEAFSQMATSDTGRVQLKQVFHADAFAAATDADFGTVREMEASLSN